MRIIDIVSALVLSAIAAYVIWTANRFPAAADTLGPEFFPKLVAGLLLAFAAAIAVKAVVRKEAQSAPEAPGAGIGLVVGAMIIYVIVLPLAGFLATTPAFLTAAGLLLAGDIRQWWKKICISAAISTGALYYLFSVLLNVPLP